MGRARRGRPGERRRAAAIVERTGRQRLAGLTAFVRHLEAAGYPGAGVDPAAAAGSCWVLICASTCGDGSGDADEARLARMPGATILGP